MTSSGWHNRRSVRLRNYDYSHAGAYFVATCVGDKRCLLSRIAHDAAELTLAGTIVQSIWDSLPRRFSGFDLDVCILIPNHIHGIIVLADGDDNVSHREAVRTFEAASTRLARTSGLPDFRWQRSYYEHVIRNESELDRVRAYIVGNPAKWEMDRENPDHGGTSARRAR